MGQFYVNDRIMVTDENHPLFGHVGKVVRVKYANESAWVDMGEVPDSLAANREVFPFPSLDNRAAWTELWPDQCEHATNG